MSFLNKMRDFVEGNYHYFNKKHNAEHINEQALWRAYLCSDCLKAGKCRICNCKTPNMFFSPNKIDSAGKWKKMLPANEWEAFKKSDNQYPFFEKTYKEYQQNLNASTELYREQQKLLGYTPPLSDPSYPYSRGVRQEEVIGVDVDDSNDGTSSLTILQSTLRREETNDTERLPSIGTAIRTVDIDDNTLQGSDDVSGTETSDVMEKED